MRVAGKPIVWLLLTAFGSVALGAPDPKYTTSPDKGLRAQVITVSHDNVEDSYDIVKILRGNWEITEYPLVRNKDGMDRQVYDSSWSPDSRFFVFLTKYYGAHSIWHSPTSIYDSKSNKFWELDAYIGEVVSDKVEFVNSDVLKVKVQNAKADATERYIVKQFSLSKWISDLTAGRE